MDDFVASVRKRADELRSLGLTERHAFCLLNAEFPHAERDTLVNAARLPGYRRGISPRWAEWGQPLRPTQIRFQQKKSGRPDEPVVVRTVPRKEPNVVVKEVYSVPAELPEPSFDAFMNQHGGFNSQGYFDACAKHQERVAAWCRVNSPSDIAGEAMRFTVADGKAVYMVYTTRPLTLIHLNYGDGYQLDEMTLRGMRLSDVRKQLRREAALDALFGRKEN